VKCLTKNTLLVLESYKAGRVSLTVTKICKTTLSQNRYWTKICPLFASAVYCDKLFCLLANQCRSREAIWRTRKWVWREEKRSFLLSRSEDYRERHKLTQQTWSGKTILVRMQVIIVINKALGFYVAYSARISRHRYSQRESKKPPELKTYTRNKLTKQKSSLIASVVFRERLCRGVYIVYPRYDSHRHIYLPLLSPCQKTDIFTIWKSSLSTFGEPTAPFAL